MGTSCSPVCGGSPQGRWPEEADTTIQSRTPTPVVSTPPPEEAADESSSAPSPNASFPPPPVRPAEPQQSQQPQKQQEQPQPEPAEQDGIDWVQTARTAGGFVADVAIPMVLGKAAFVGFTGLCAPLLGPAAVGCGVAASYALNAASSSVGQMLANGHVDTRVALTDGLTGMAAGGSSKWIGKAADFANSTKAASKAAGVATKAIDGGGKAVKGTVETVVQVLGNGSAGTAARSTGAVLFTSGDLQTRLDAGGEEFSDGTAFLVGGVAGAVTQAGINRALAKTVVLKADPYKHLSVEAREILAEIRSRSLDQGLPEGTRIIYKLDDFGRRQSFEGEPVIHAEQMALDRLAKGSGRVIKDVDPAAVSAPPAGPRQTSAPPPLQSSVEDYETALVSHYSRHVLNKGNAFDGGSQDKLLPQLIIHWPDGKQSRWVDTDEVERIVNARPDLLRAAHEMNKKIGES